MRIQNPEIFSLHAEFCKVLANEKRLMILALLAKREMNVGEITASLDLYPANVSQHLSLLRSKNIVQTRREGQMVYYRLTDPRLIVGCELIRSVLLQDLQRRGLVAQELRVENLVLED